MGCKKRRTRTKNPTEKTVNQLLKFTGDMTALSIGASVGIGTSAQISKLMKK